MDKNKSDFGSGCAYCLGLFVAHEFKRINIDNKFEVSLWFNGAADHLFDLVIPNEFNDKIKERLAKFQEKCLGWRLPLETKEFPNVKDYNWAINEAKELLRLIDEENGIKTKEAVWK